MILTVHAKPGAVRKVLMDRGIDPVYVDYDGDTCEVCVIKSHGVNAMADLRLAGIRVDIGAPHNTAHSDPTFAQAAQHILRKSHGQRTPS